MHIDIFDENKNENWPDSMSWLDVRWSWKRSGVGRLIQKCKYFTSVGFHGIARFAEFVNRVRHNFSQRYRLIITMPFVLFSQFNLSLIYSIFKAHFSFMKFWNSFIFSSFFSFQRFLLFSKKSMIKFSMQSWIVLPIWISREFGFYATRIMNPKPRYSWKTIEYFNDL